MSKTANGIDTKFFLMRAILAVFSIYLGIMLGIGCFKGVAMLTIQMFNPFSVITIMGLSAKTPDVNILLGFCVLLTLVFILSRRLPTWTCAGLVFAHAALAYFFLTMWRS
jgi:hypothetical protein